MIPNGVHTIPVAYAILPNYLEPSVQTHFRWIDNKKPLFSFGVRLESSIYNCDDALNAFLPLVPGCTIEPRPEVDKAVRFELAAAAALFVATYAPCTLLMKYASTGRLHSKPFKSSHPISPCSTSQHSSIASSAS